MRRLSRLLLVMFVLPVALVVSGPASPGHAAAAVAVTAAAEDDPYDWKGANWTVDAYGPGIGEIEFADIDCFAAVSWIFAQARFSTTNGECVGGFDLTPGWSQTGEAGSLVNVWAAGPGCKTGTQDLDGGGAQATMGNHALNGTTTVAGSWGFMSYIENVGCAPVQACIRLQAQGDPGSDSVAVECVNVNFKAPPSGSTCQYGTPQAGWWQTRLVEGGTYAGWTAIWAGFRLAGGTIGHEWTLKPVYMNGGQPVGGQGEWKFFVDADGLMFIKQQNPRQVPIGYDLIGVQVSKLDYTDSAFPPRAGYTKPGECDFYFGTKFRATATDETDEPWGQNVDGSGEGGAPPITGNPPVSGGPDDNDTPTTDVGWLKWLFDLMKQLLKVMGHMLRAILGLGAQIAGALLGMLQDLFIPDPGSWGVTELMQQTRAKPPFSLAGPLADQASAFGGSFSGAGECATLANFDIPVGNSTISCASIKNSPGIGGFYALVKFGLIALTVLALFRMVHAAIQDASG